MVKYIKKDLDITKPRHSEHVLPVPWSFRGSTVIGEINCLIYHFPQLLKDDLFKHAASTFFCLW